MTDWTVQQPYWCKFYPGRDCPGCTFTCERIDESLGDIEIMSVGKKPEHISAADINKQMKGKEVRRWADEAMYSTAPMAEPGELVKPKVTVVNMTQNPLRVMAAACQGYRGDFVSDPSEVPIAMAQQWLADMQKTTLNAGLEFIDIHLMYEGVSRAFMDQATRQRTAVFVCESLRFSVKEFVSTEVVMPPSIEALPEDAPARKIWMDTVSRIDWAYMNLVNSGIPAEDARGLIPLNIAVRFHHKTNLRNLVDHAGMRLCSQAQYEWKLVWTEIIKAITAYGPESERWQQRAIASIFKPVCYHTGKCEFMAATDRHCIIRDRVEAHHQNGDRPETWTDINPHEPLLSFAARKAPSNVQQ